MSETGVEKQRKSPPEADTLLGQTTDALKSLRESLARNANADDLNKRIGDAAQAMERAKEYVADQTNSATQALRNELTLLPDTLKALPDAVKNTSAQNIAALEESRKSFFETVSSAAKTGFSRTMDTLATGMEKAGEFFGKIWEGMKPTLKRFIDMPVFAYFMGPETLKTLKAALGYDEAAEALEKDIRERLPDTTKFSIASKKEVTAFKDLYDKILQKMNRSPEKYSRGAFIHDILGTYVQTEGVAEVTMKAIVEGGKKLVNDTKEVPQAPASSEPPKK